VLVPAAVGDFQNRKNKRDLSTHAIVGAAIATLFPDHPALAFASGVASHFAGLAAVLLGALGAMLPDPLRLMHRLFPREPLRTLQRFGVWIDSSRKLRWPLGIASQASFVVLVVTVIGVFRYTSS
jgi:hypothetical protein